RHAYDSMEVVGLQTDWIGLDSDPILFGRSAVFDPRVEHPARHLHGRRVAQGSHLRATLRPLAGRNAFPLFLPRRRATQRVHRFLDRREPPSMASRARALAMGNDLRRRRTLHSEPKARLA